MTTTSESTENEETPAASAHNSMTRALPPSHILQDGRFIYLPPLSDTERGRFLERSIAKHGLLNQDLTHQHNEAKEGHKSEEKEEESPDVKVHPLAVASARLNANGISELSKAINLAGLVTGTDYLGLSNIVDPSLELPTADTTEQQEGSGTPSGPTVATAPLDNAADSRLRAEFVGTRKHAQFCSATVFLERQSQRLSQALTAQAVMDDRLLQLRNRWRLVAPEHGTRAQPHAVRPTEVVAMDVHVYDRDRTGGGNQALLSSNSSREKEMATAGAFVQGRIARRVPRYATVELKGTYDVSQHVKDWKERVMQSTSETEEETADAVMTEATDVAMADVSASDNSSSCQTRCEPFAVADPTLGKLDVDFDPEKVPMLTLELTIEKASTGYSQSACLSPISGAKDSAKEDDEDVVVALQHSLFCASLFETIRKELLSSSDDSQQQQYVWLSSHAEETFLPPPSQMAGSIYNGDVASLCVVHCHEGEVKVQLDSEYFLIVKLIEAAASTQASLDTESSSSGSQSPAQLRVLCRSLLLNIQDVYHRFCFETQSTSLKEAKEEDAPGLARIKRKSVIPSPHILQNCVSLGSKMLFESKVRRVLKRVAKWLKLDMHTDEALVVTWLPLSVFDLRSQFALNFREFLADVSIDRDGMRVTTCCGSENGYKCVDFNSDVVFEMFLKQEIQKLLKTGGVGDMEET